MLYLSRAVISTSGSSLLTDLVSWWTFDEASGDRLDSHGSNDLAEYEAGLSPTSVAGKVNNATQYTPNDASLCSSPVGVQGGDRDFTVVAWVRSTGAAVITGIVMAYGDPIYGGQRDWILRLDQNPIRYEFVVFGTSGVFKASATTHGTVVKDAWVMLVGQHDSVNNLAKISVNNGAFDTAAISDAVTNGVTDNLFVGRDGSVFSRLTIDETGFWSRLLTADEITELYNAGAGIGYPG